MAYKKLKGIAYSFIAATSIYTAFEFSSYVHTEFQKRDVKSNLEMMVLGASNAAFLTIGIKSMIKGKRDFMKKKQ